MIRPGNPTGLKFNFRPIGMIESPYKEKFGTPRQPGLVQESRGSILLRDDLNPDSLEGLADYSHVWVVFVFHENQSVREGRETVKTKVHPPRLEGKSVGVFATRSPHRPNPIGLSLLEIEKIEGRRVFVRGLDLIDKTPVLDLKPYLPNVESVAGAFEGWSGEIVSRSVLVEWSPLAKENLRALSGTANSETELQAAIEKSLELDPRPVSYRGTFENPDPYTSLYGFRFDEWNVVFQMLPASPGPDAGADSDATSGAPLQPKRARIERIELWPKRSKR